MQRIFSLSLKQLLLAGWLTVGFSAVATSLWHKLHYPMKPLYVEIYNETGELIPSIVIEHGNINTQEKIQSVQIQPGERRLIALNHQPELGFNIEANYANGKHKSICAGKFSKEWFLRASVVSAGIYITEIR